MKRTFMRDLKGIITDRQVFGIAALPTPTTIMKQALLANLKATYKNITTNRIMHSLFSHSKGNKGRAIKVIPAVSTI